MRVKASRSLHQQTHQFPCPYCRKNFTDVLQHLNHRDSKCGSWFALSPPLKNLAPPCSLDPHNFMDETDSTYEMDSTYDTYPPPPIVNPEHARDASPNHPQLLQIEFSTAGKIYGHMKTFVDRFNDDKHASYWTQNPYYPFADQEEWELGSFLLGSGLSIQKVDEFLKLKLVSHLYHPFPSLADLFSDQDYWSHIPLSKGTTKPIEILPTVPEWNFKNVSLTGHATKEPTLLFYRYALNCVEYLFSNPLFADEIDFCPVQLYHDLEQMVCVYTEWMSGKKAWDMQVRSRLSSHIQWSYHPVGDASRWCNTPWCYPLLRQDQHLCYDR